MRRREHIRTMLLASLVCVLILSCVAGDSSAGAFIIEGDRIEKDRPVEKILPAFSIHGAVITPCDCAPPRKDVKDLERPAPWALEDRPLESYTGVYSNPFLGELVVSKRDDRLVLIFESGLGLEAMRIDGDLFDTCTDIVRLGRVRFGFESFAGGKAGRVTIPLEDGEVDLVFSR